MLRYLTIFLFFLAVNFWFIYDSHIDNREEILRESYNVNELNIHKIIDKYKVNSDVTFENLINTPQILELFAKASDQNTAIQQEVRQSIYHLLKRPYENLKKIANVRQLHFHLPDGKSFLRMHRPNKYGDPLFDVRYSVKQTNQKKIFTQGFEEGRIFNGYRFVYPINNGNKHLGSIEISISMAAIINSLENVYKKNYCFILDSAVIDKKVFDNEKGNYAPSIFGTSFAVDKGVDSPACKSPDPDLMKLTQSSDIERKLKNKEAISDVFRVNGHIYIIHMIPYKNVPLQKNEWVLSGSGSFPIV